MPCHPKDSTSQSKQIIYLPRSLARPAVLVPTLGTLEAAHPFFPLPSHATNGKPRARYVSGRWRQVASAIPSRWLSHVALLFNRPESSNVGPGAGQASSMPQLASSWETDGMDQHSSSSIKGIFLTCETALASSYSTPLPSARPVINVRAARQPGHGPRSARTSLAHTCLRRHAGLLPALSVMMGGPRRRPKLLCMPISARSAAASLCFVFFFFSLL